MALSNTESVIGLLLCRGLIFKLGKPINIGMSEKNAYQFSEICASRKRPGAVLQSRNLMVTLFV
jgi:hypothetical protein